MKINIKKAWIIAPVLAIAVYAGCTKGPDIKSYSYPVAVPQGITPGSGYPGSYLTINGSSFGDYRGVVKVYFNGILADTVVSCEDGKIVVQVPSAAQSGKVSLQVWDNKFDSIGAYTVFPPLSISKTGLLGGLLGDTIRIQGSGLGTDASKIKVKFNGADGVVASVNDSVITLTVPTGAADGNLSVSVNDSLLAGPQFKLLAPIGVSPTYQLDFEGDLMDKISGVAATYTQNLASVLSYPDGISGKCVNLAGFNPTAATWVVNQAIQIPTAIVKQKEFTVACWVNWSPSRSTYQDPIFDFGEARGTRLTVMARMSGNWNSTSGKQVGRFLLQKKVKDATGTLVDYEDYFPATVLTTGVWTHVAFSFSYTNQEMKIYQNGVLTGTKTLIRTDVDPTMINMNRAFIGCPSYGSGSEPSFGGMIDKFLVYNSILTQDQIYTLYFKK